MKNKRLYLLFFIFFIPLCFILSQCINSSTQTDVRGSNYAGSEKCARCHKDIYGSYLHTAHNQTSGPATLHSVHGSFAEGQNTFRFYETVVKMENHNGDLYQVAYKGKKPFISQKFDIAVGGVKAETYLGWKGDQLFELPISYFKNIHSWTISPGYSRDVPNFSRPVISRCMECHSSYINEKEQSNENMTTRGVQFEKSSIILGIDCERCHGPAAEHVNYQTSHPAEKKSKFLISYGSLTRAQKLDACAVCHSGNKDNFQVSAFNFKPGDTLSKFKETEFLRKNLKPGTMDVHGNQNGLLAASKCFLMSKMDCNTCHNTHENEKMNLAAYSLKCISCHTKVNHNSYANSQSAMLTNNCIDCHMPEKPSNTIKVASADSSGVVHYLARSHYIAVYPMESKKIMAFIKR
jgi:hypothetical protein